MKSVCVSGVKVRLVDGSWESIRGGGMTWEWVLGQMDKPTVNLEVNLTN